MIFKLLNVLFIVCHSLQMKLDVFVKCLSNVPLMTKNFNYTFRYFLSSILKVVHMFTPIKNISKFSSMDVSPCI